MTRAGIEGAERGEVSVTLRMGDSDVTLFDVPIPQVGARVEWRDNRTGDYWRRDRGTLLLKGVVESVAYYYEDRGTDAQNAYTRTGVIVHLRPL